LKGEKLADRTSKPIVDMERIKLLLIDHQQIMRNGIRHMLEGTNIEVAYETGSGTEAMELIAKHKPDVVLANLSTTDFDGFEFMKSASEEHPESPILVLSDNTNEDYIRRAVASGASGFLANDVDKEDLAMAIRAVSSGQIYFSTRIAQSITDVFIRKVKNNQPDGPAQGAQITSRELQILELISEGYSSSEIANKLYISSRTVENHRANIMQKFRVKNAAELVRYAFVNKILTLQG